MLMPEALFWKTNVRGTERVASGAISTMAGVSIEKPFISERLGTPGPGSGEPIAPGRPVVGALSYLSQRKKNNHK